MESGSRQSVFGLGSWADVAWLVSISSTLLLVLLPFSSYIASIPFIEWDMSNSQAAVVFSAYLVGYAVSSAFLIPVTDRLPAGTGDVRQRRADSGEQHTVPSARPGRVDGLGAEVRRGRGTRGRVYTGHQDCVAEFRGRDARDGGGYIRRRGIRRHDYLIRVHGAIAEPDRFVADGVHDNRAGRAWLASSSR